LPLFSPTQWRFGHRPVKCQPTPVQAFQIVIVAQRFFPQAYKQALSFPFLKPRVGCGAFAKTCGVQGFPLATSAQNKENAVQDFSVGYPLAVTTQGVLFLLAHWQQRLNPFPQRIGNQKLLDITVCFHGT
jgi:hypothetical protein